MIILVVVNRTNYS